MDLSQLADTETHESLNNMRQSLNNAPVGSSDADEERERQRSEASSYTAPLLKKPKSKQTSAAYPFDHTFSRSPSKAHEDYYPDGGSLYVAAKTAISEIDSGTSSYLEDEDAVDEPAPLLMWCLHLMLVPLPQDKKGKRILMYFLLAMISLLPIVPYPYSWLFTKYDAHYASQGKFDKTGFGEGLLVSVFETVGMIMAWYGLLTAVRERNIYRMLNIEFRNHGGRVCMLILLHLVVYISVVISNTYYYGACRLYGFNAFSCRPLSSLEAKPWTVRDSKGSARNFSWAD